MHHATMLGLLTADQPSPTKLAAPDMAATPGAPRSPASQ
jgi:hypothetical protein